MPDQVAQNTRRAQRLLALPAAVVAGVVAIVLVLLIPWFVAIPVGLLAGAGVAFWAQGRATATVVRLVGAAPADPAAHARLHNLVEGLCLANGLAVPTIQVLDQAAPNALVAGRRPQDAILVVTTGLLDQLDRVELEGVIAHELSRIKSLDIVPATVAVSTIGLVPVAGLRARLLAGALGSDRMALADAAAVEMTRYPPGLVSALEKVRDGAASAPLSAPLIAHLWIDAAASAAAGDAPAQPPIQERIDALRER